MKIIKKYKNFLLKDPSIQSYSRIERFLKKESVCVCVCVCVCVACSRCHYSRTAVEFNCSKYDLDLTNIIHTAAMNSKNYICKTFHLPT